MTILPSKSLSVFLLLSVLFPLLAAAQESEAMKEQKLDKQDDGQCLPQEQSAGFVQGPVEP